MLTDVQISLAAAGVYALATVVFVALSRFQRPELRKYCHLLAGVVAVSAIGSALSGLGVLQVPVGGVPLDVPSTVDDLVAYPVVFGLAAVVAGASRRAIGLLVGLSVASVVASVFLELVGAGTALLVLGAMVASYLARVYLLFGPVWRAAKRQSDDRRLLYWKFRNLLVFLMGFVFVAIGLSLVGWLDTFTMLLVIEYVNVLLRVGFAGFLIGNLSALADPEATAA